MKLLFSLSVLGLAWFAVVGACVSLVAWMLARPLLRRHSAPSGWLLTLRLLPAAAATTFAGLVFGPAHLRLEPADADEAFGVVVVSLACVGLAQVAVATWRAGRVFLAARRVRRWVTTPLAMPAGCAYEIEGFPGISLAGVLRTRILVGSDARDTLTRDELDAAIAHEAAHRSALDNVKRCAMFCAPDLFGWTRTAASLEARWRAAAESRADTSAVRGDPGRAVHLASALVKIAKLARRAPGRLQSPVWSTFHEPSLLEGRVRHLLGGPALHPGTTGRSLGLSAALAGFLLVWLAAAGSPRIHELTESLIAFLP